MLWSRIGAMPARLPRPTSSRRPLRPGLPTLGPAHECWRSDGCSAITCRSDSGRCLLPTIWRRIRQVPHAMGAPSRCRTGARPGRHRPGDPRRARILNVKVECTCCGLPSGQPAGRGLRQLAAHRSAIPVGVDDAVPSVVLENVAGPGPGGGNPRVDGRRAALGTAAIRPGPAAGRPADLQTVLVGRHPLATSPATSPGPCLKPVDSDPTYALNRLAPQGFRLSSARRPPRRDVDPADGPAADCG